ncbi:MAG: hypothetical protein LIO77_01015, partial [Rikenellaceae bacterium]|nr:hypothetical protein [Rikenellaceae bacterium]
TPTMKRISKIITPAFAAAWMLASCATVGGINLDDLEISPEEKFSSTIHFVSKLDDGAMGSTASDYTAVDSYFTTTLNKKAGSWLGIVERTDVTYSAGTMFNPGVGIAYDADRWSFFALQNISNKTVWEGATILFNDYTTSIGSIELGSGSRIYGFAPTMDGTRTDDDGSVNEVSLPIEYRYVRMSDASHVAALGGDNGALNTLKNQARNFLVVGTVKNGLESSLASVLAETDDSFVSEIVAGGTDYSIFVLYETRFWKLKSYDTVSLGSGITAYEIEMMW